MPRHTLNYRDPIGVFPPAFMASAVIADLNDAKAGKARFHPERAPIVLGPEEARKRAGLFLRARLGDQAAVVVLAREYRLRLVVGA